MAARSRILIVEKYPLMLRGLSSALAGEQGMEVIGSASTGELGVHLASQIKVDVVLVDTQLEDLSAWDTVARLRQSSRHTATVIMTTDINDIQACLALAVGATLCVMKSTPAEDLVEAIRKACRSAETSKPSCHRANCR